MSVLNDEKGYLLGWVCTTAGTACRGSVSARAAAWPLSSCRSYRVQTLFVVDCSLKARLTHKPAAHTKHTQGHMCTSQSPHPPRYLPFRLAILFARVPNLLLLAPRSAGVSSCIEECSSKNFVLTGCCRAVPHGSIFGVLPASSYSLRSYEALVAPPSGLPTSVLVASTGSIAGCGALKIAVWP